MKIIEKVITINELKEMSERMFGNLVKAMVDVRNKIMAVDGELHADLLEFLILERKSDPKDIWGINIYPDKIEDDFIEFDSVMNLKPSLGNRTRGVESQKLREEIISVVNKLVKR